MNYEFFQYTKLIFVNSGSFLANSKALANKSLQLTFLNTRQISRSRHLLFQRETNKDFCLWEVLSEIIIQSMGGFDFNFFLYTCFNDNMLHLLSQYIQPFSLPVFSIRVFELLFMGPVLMFSFPVLSPSDTNVMSELVQLHLQNVNFYHFNKNPSCLDLAILLS